MYIQPIKPSVKLHISDLIDEMEDSMMHSDEDTNNNFVICGIKNYGYNRGGSGDEPDHGLIVWAKPSNRAYNKTLIKNGFTTYKLDSLSIYDVLNPTGLNAIKSLAGKEIDSIMLTAVKPKASMIRPFHKEDDNVYSNYGLSDLLVDWFVDYCNLLFKTIYNNETSTQENCGYCHFKYGKEGALTSEKQFHHDESYGNASAVYLDCDNVLKFEAENGDIETGYDIEQELKPNYCPHCGRPLLITTEESCDIADKINWEYSTNNTRNEF